MRKPDYRSQRINPYKETFLLSIIGKLSGFKRLLVIAATLNFELRVYKTVHRTSIPVALSLHNLFNWTERWKGFTMPSRAKLLLEAPRRGFVCMAGGFLLFLSFASDFTYANLNTYVTSYMRTTGYNPGLTYADFIIVSMTKYAVQVGLIGWFQCCLLL